MPIAFCCGIVVLLLVIIICLCLSKDRFQKLTRKMYGFANIDEIENQEVLKQELDFINKSINGLSAIILTFVATIVAVFVKLRIEIQCYLTQILPSIPDNIILIWVALLLVSIFLIYLVIYSIEMYIKVPHKNKIIEKLQKMEKNDEKTTTCH